VTIAATVATTAAALITAIAATTTIATTTTTKDNTPVPCPYICQISMDVYNSFTVALTAFSVKLAIKLFCYFKQQTNWYQYETV